MPETNGRYEAGFTAAEIDNLKADVAEIKSNVQRLVGKLWQLETRVYMIAGGIAVLAAKSSDILAYWFGGK